MGVLTQKCPLSRIGVLRKRRLKRIRGPSKRPSKRVRVLKQMPSKKDRAPSKGPSKENGHPFNMRPHVLQRFSKASSHINLREENLLMHGPSLRDFGPQAFDLSIFSFIRIHPISSWHTCPGDVQGHALEKVKLWDNMEASARVMEHMFHCFLPPQHQLFCNA